MSKPSRILMMVALTAILSGCAAYQAQRQPAAAPPADMASPTAPARTGTTDAHASGGNQAIVDQFARESAGEKQLTLLSQLEVYKQELAEQGKYDCCVRPGCNECVLRRGECQCRIGVEKGGPCCGECTAAWIEGRGDVPGVSKEEILRNLGCYRELYEGGPQTESAPDSGNDPSSHHHHASSEAESDDSHHH